MLCLLCTEHLAYPANISIHQTLQGTAPAETELSNSKHGSSQSFSAQHRKKKKVAKALHLLSASDRARVIMFSIIFNTGWMPAHGRDKFLVGQNEGWNNAVPEDLKNSDLLVLEGVLPQTSPLLTERKPPWITASLRLERPLSLLVQPSACASNCSKPDPSVPCPPFYETPPEMVTPLPGQLVPTHWLPGNLTTKDSCPFCLQ